MQAVIQTGGKQYIVKKGDMIEVEYIHGEVGKEVVFSSVLMTKEDEGNEDIEVGKPFLANTVVNGKIKQQMKGKKVIIFKHKRRKNYRKKIGHRQLLSKIEITDIVKN